MDNDQSLASKRIKGILIDRDKYKEVQRIFQLLLDLPSEKREQKLKSETNDPEIKDEVIELLKNTNEETILSQDSSQIKKKHVNKHKPVFRWFFSSKQKFRLTLVLSLLALILVSIWTHQMVKDSILKMRADELSRTIESLKLSVDFWSQDYIHDVRRISEDRELEELVAEYVFLLDDSDPYELAESEKGIQLNDLLGELIDSNRYSGYAVISREGTVLSSNYSSSLHYQLREEGRGLLARVLGGEAVFGPPLMAKDWVSGEPNPILNKPNLWVEVPIYDSQGNAKAILAVAKPANKEFSDLFSVNRLGKTGESYAVSGRGLLLSESRFNDDLVEIGLIEKDPFNGVLSLSIKDPGVNLYETTPLEKSESWRYTKAAQTIIYYSEQGFDSTTLSVEPYRDYRGVEVIGAFTWFSDYNFGAITEIDIDEAYKPLNYVTFSFIGIVLGFAGFIIFSLFTSLQIIRIKKQSEDKLGQYFLQKQIGEGGMSKVYLASHEFLKRPTAVKILKKEELNEKSLIRFKREAQQISRLRNPHTVELYDYGETENGVFYYAMEYLDGMNVKELVKMGGAIPLGRALHILIHACYSIKEAHELNLIHRDIKPQNVMICVMGGLYDMVKVLDFGLVKDLDVADENELTQQAEISGTPLYMAPERILTPKKTDVRSDIYSLGALAYYMISGKPIFEYSGDLDVLYQALNSEVTPLQMIDPEIPESLSNIVDMCLAKDPDDRPETVDSIISILSSMKEKYTWTQSEAREWWMRLRG